MDTQLESGPSAPEPLGTFARAIMVETTGHPGRRAVDCAISIAIHAAIIWTLTILPLFFLEDLHAYTRTRTMLVTSVPPSSSSEPQFRPRAGRPANKSRFRFVNLSAPISGARDAPAEAVEAAPVQEEIPLGVTGGIANFLDGSETGPLSAVFPVPPPAGQILHVGGDVRKARLVYGMSVAYPELARQWRIFGKVVIEAVIDARGKVRKAHAVSGPGLLAKAAVEAVSREKFEPTLIDGQPIQCDLIVEVTFRLFDGDSFLMR